MDLTEAEDIKKRWQEYTEGGEGSPKMTDKQDWETPFVPTNSSKDHLNAE